MSPKLSVCMPVFNNERFLAEAIESVLVQTFRDFEFIIIDDRSTDRSREIIDGYAERDHRIISRANQTNLGLPGNWNACLRTATGEYIKFLFGDDVLAKPYSLERYVSALDNNPEAVLAASSRYLIDEDSRIINTSDLQKSGREEGIRVITDCLIDQQNIIGEPSAVIFRKELASRGFKEKYRQIVDLEMWLHLLERGSYLYINEPLCSFRIHHGQATQRNLEQGLNYDDTSQLLKDYAEKPYVRFSRFLRSYIYFAPAYGIWKLYKKHRKISRESALGIIRERYHFTPVGFIAFRPFYRIYRNYRRWKKWLKNMNSYIKTG